MILLYRIQLSDALQGHGVVEVGDRPKRPLPDVCSCLVDYVSKSAWKGQSFACRDLPITILFQTFGI